MRARVPSAILSMLLLSFGLASAAQAADWQVVRGPEVCTTQLTLTARRAPPMTLTFTSDGERNLVRMDPAAAATIRDLRIDRRRVNLAPDATGATPFTPAQAAVFARGNRLSAEFKTGPARTASLAGSGRGLRELAECGEQIRLAKGGPISAAEAANTGAF
ncbi:MAG TPA: hypothetical protein VIO94_16835, partial [Phenylobacterium sp.]